MTDPQILARADANYFRAMAEIVAGMPGGEARERDGILSILAPVPVPMFNVAFVTRPLADPHRAIREAVAEFDARGLPCLVRVRDGVDVASERAAEALGMPYSDSVPGLVIENVDGAAAAVADLDIRTVAGETLAAYSDALADGFGMPRDLTARMLAPGILALPDVELYAGYQDGRVVATSALILRYRVAGVYNVSTLESYRRRGYGEAMTAHAVHRGAAIGATIASLQASEMGRPIYERMGFRLVAEYRTYHRPGV